MGRWLVVGDRIAADVFKKMGLRMASLFGLDAWMDVCMCVCIWRSSTFGGSTHVWFMV